MNVLFYRTIPLFWSYRVFLFEITAFYFLVLGLYFYWFINFNCIVVSQSVKVGKHYRMTNKKGEIQ
jgi:hypothetical protein